MLSFIRQNKGGIFNEKSSMRRVRVIPVLLLKNGGLVKSVKFKNFKYVGDPINAVKIFNEKEVDEIVILDIDASKENRGPDLEKVKEIASEAFIPLGYGGGITNIDQIKALLFHGVEKVVLNASTHHSPALITEAARQFGSQSVVVSIDVKKNLFGKHRVFQHVTGKSTSLDPLTFAKEMVERGAGEIFLNSVDLDGTQQGYDMALVDKISKEVEVPVIICGGARHIADFRGAIQTGASACAAGSIFVFHGEHKAVLISYPSQENLKKELFEHL